MKTLLLIPSVAKSGLDAAVSADLHPTMDYEALRRALAAEPDSQVELVDYAAVERSRDPTVRMVAKLAGHNAALAWLGFARRHEFDTIFTNAESVAMPLALLFKCVSKRPNHVTIGHRLSARKKRAFYTVLRVHDQMDAIFVYATSQRDYARAELGIPDATLRLIPFHADHRFFRPLAEVAPREHQVCAAGLEWRDYPTLIQAVAEKSELAVRLAAASPWSKHNNETESRTLPAHVDARRYDYHGLRQLYAESSIVVVPLYENDFQAGITTILEAMAMGKPVVVTGTSGQTDVIIDGENGLYVPPASASGWSEAIDRLRADTALRAKLGARARQWLEENATLDRWVEHVMAAIRGEPSLPNVFEDSRTSRERLSGAVEVPAAGVDPGQSTLAASPANEGYASRSASEGW